LQQADLALPDVHRLFKRRPVEGRRQHYSPYSAGKAYMQAFSKQ
jgi:hypothetical protein